MVRVSPHVRERGKVEGRWGKVCCLVSHEGTAYLREGRRADPEPVEQVGEPERGREGGLQLEEALVGPEQRRALGEARPSPQEFPPSGVQAYQRMLVSRVILRSDPSLARKALRR